MSRILRAVRVSAAPGITLYRLTSSATDVTGREWPAGTEYVPIAGGATPAKRGASQDVTIKGRRVSFAFGGAL